MLPGHVWLGKIKYEWESDGTFTIVRQDNGAAVQLSRSEVAILVQVLGFYSIPVAPPYQPIDVTERQVPT